MPCTLSHTLNTDPESCYTFQYATPQGNLLVDAERGSVFDATQTPLSANPIVYESSDGALQPLAVGTVVGSLQTKVGCSDLPRHLVGQCLVPVRDGRLPTVHECVTSRTFVDVSKVYQNR